MFVSAASCFYVSLLSDLKYLCRLCSSHRLSIWGENEEEEELENLKEALESFCAVSMRALKEQH